MSVTKKVSVSFPIGTILFLVFLVLKLTGNIDWPWWWITSPLWIPLAIIAAIVVVVVMAALVGSILNRY